MIKITDKHDCCGCSACVQRCPKQCISLKEDEEGFLYPKVNIDECIDCHLCEKVCPWLNRPDKLQPLEVFAVKNRNEEERMSSSSGGVFIAIAKKVIERGGVVFGAVFDDNWEVVHTYSETIDGVKPMMGSKYVQSRMGDCYREAENFLKSGREVMFTGTPCQITGLHKFLRKEYSNLLSVDFLCHGVPSPGVWRKYLTEAFDIHTQKCVVRKKTDKSEPLTTAPVITDIDFRNKRLKGWRDYSFVVYGNLSVSDKKQVLLADSHNENPFMRGFLNDVYLRPSCYNCKCKNGISHSDLTIADYWAIDLFMPNFNDDKGVSLVIVNTQRGKELFDCLNMDKKCSSLSDAKPMNGGFKEYISENPKRKMFFEYLSNGDSVEVAVDKFLYVPAYKVMLTRLKNKIIKAIKS